MSYNSISSSSFSKTDSTGSQSEIKQLSGKLNGIAISNPPNPILDQQSKIVQTVSIERFRNWLSNIAPNISKYRCSINESSSPLASTIKGLFNRAMDFLFGKKNATTMTEVPQTPGAIESPVLPQKSPEELNEGGENLAEEEKPALAESSPESTDVEQLKSEEKVESYQEKMLRDELNTLNKEIDEKEARIEEAQSKGKNVKEMVKEVSELYKAQTEIEIKLQFLQARAESSPSNVKVPTGLKSALKNNNSPKSDKKVNVGFTETIEEKKFEKEEAPNKLQKTSTFISPPTLTEIEQLQVELKNLKSTQETIEDRIVKEHKKLEDSEAAHDTENINKHIQQENKLYKAYTLNEARIEELEQQINSFNIELLNEELIKQRSNRANVMVQLQKNPDSSDLSIEFKKVNNKVQNLKQQMTSSLKPLKEYLERQRNILNEMFQKLKDEKQALNNYPEGSEEYTERKQQVNDLYSTFSLEYKKFEKLKNQIERMDASIEGKKES